MQVTKTNKFDKNFRKRILGQASLEKKFQERVAMFIPDRKDPVLKDHKLSGDFRAFWITGDIRVIYILLPDNLALFIDIGSHNQVYK